MSPSVLHAYSPSILWSSFPIRAFTTTQNRSLPPPRAPPGYWRLTRLAVPVVERGADGDHREVVGRLRGVGPAALGVPPVVAPRDGTDETVGEVLPDVEPKVHLGTRGEETVIRTQCLTVDEGRVIRTQSLTGDNREGQSSEPSLTGDERRGDSHQNPKSNWGWEGRGESSEPKV